MRKYTFILLLALVSLSCSTEYANSRIEVITYDNQLVSEIESNFDSAFTEYPKRDDFWTIDYYLTDSTENRIMKDSLGNIVSIVMFKDGKRVFIEEYYPNGQLIVKNDFPPDRIDGPVTSFYPNGQIESTGQWKDLKKVGEWRHYNATGQLETIEYYDQQGKLKRTEEITTTHNTGYKQ